MCIANSLLINVTVVHCVLTCDCFQTINHPRLISCTPFVHFKKAIGITEVLQEGSRVLLTLDWIRQIDKIRWAPFERGRRYFELQKYKEEEEEEEAEAEWKWILAVNSMYVCFCGLQIGVRNRHGRFTSDFQRGSEQYPTTRPRLDVLSDGRHRRSFAGKKWLVSVAN